MPAMDWAACMHGSAVPNTICRALARGPVLCLASDEEVKTECAEKKQSDAATGQASRGACLGAR